MLAAVSAGPANEIYISTYVFNSILGTDSSYVELIRNPEFAAVKVAGKN